MFSVVLVYAKSWSHSDIISCCQSAHVFTSRYDSTLLGCAFFTPKVFLHNPISRLTVVSREANKKQHVCVSSGPLDHYSELFTRMAALKFENALIQPP